MTDIKFDENNEKIIEAEVKLRITDKLNNILRQLSDNIKTLHNRELIVYLDDNLKMCRTVNDAGYYEKRLLDILINEVNLQSNYKYGSAINNDIISEKRKIMKSLNDLQIQFKGTRQEDKMLNIAGDIADEFERILLYKYCK